MWSLALRRDTPAPVPEVRELIRCIEVGETLLSTGLVLQELLQGFSGPKARTQIMERFSAPPLIAPHRDDHIEAAEMRNGCRRAGVQIGTIDALLAQLCIRHNLTMLTMDTDFWQSWPIASGDENISLRRAITNSVDLQKPVRFFRGVSAGARQVSASGGGSRATERAGSARTLRSLRSYA